MTRSQWRTVLSVALRLIITVLFIPAILVKLRHPVEWGHLFTTWGYPAWGAVAVSAAEILALFMLWIPFLSKAATAVLMITLTGATATWLVHGPRSTAAYPGTILLLVAGLATLQAYRGRVRLER